MTTDSAVAANPREDAARWMRAVWGTHRSGEVFEVTAKTVSPQGKVYWVTQHASLDDMLEGALEGHIEALADQGCDVYAGLVALSSVPEHGRGGSVNRGHTSAIWIDLDCQAPGRKSDKLFEEANEALAAVRATSLGEPQVIVDSGWGIHACWLLDSPVAGADVSAAVRRIATEVSDKSGRHVDRVHDVTRVLRLPGTKNFRDGVAARDVRLLQVRDDRLSWSDVRSRLGLTDEDLAAGRQERVTHPELPPHRRGGERPLLDVGTLFEDTTTWSDVLEPFGWTPIPGAPGEQCWLRPGLDEREAGHNRSGVVYEDGGGGLMVVFSDSPETGLMSLRLAENRHSAGIGVIDRWRAYVDLAWGGDWNAANADALRRAMHGEDSGSWPQDFFDALTEEMDLAVRLAESARRRAILRAARMG